MSSKSTRRPLPGQKPNVDASGTTTSHQSKSLPSHIPLGSTRTFQFQQACLTKSLISSRRKLRLGCMNHQMLHTDLGGSVFQRRMAHCDLYTTCSHLMLSPSGMPRFPLLLISLSKALPATLVTSCWISLWATITGQSMFPLATSQAFNPPLVRSETHPSQWDPPTLWLYSMVMLPLSLSPKSRALLSLL